MLLTLKMFNRGEQRPSTTYQSKSSVVFFFKVQWFPLMALYHVRLHPFAKPMNFFPFSLFAAFLLLCLGVILISRSYVNRSLRKTPPCGVTLNTTPRTQFLNLWLHVPYNKATFANTCMKLSEFSINWKRATFILRGIKLKLFTYSSLSLRASFTYSE